MLLVETQYQEKLANLETQLRGAGSQRQDVHDAKQSSAFVEASLPVLPGSMTTDDDDGQEADAVSVAISDDTAVIADGANGNANGDVTPDMLSLDTELLDVSSARGRAELAHRGMLANRIPPSRRVFSANEGDLAANSDYLNDAAALRGIDPHADDHELGEPIHVAKKRRSAPAAPSTATSSDCRPVALPHPASADAADKRPTTIKAVPPSDLSASGSTRLPSAANAALAAIMKSHVANTVSPAFATGDSSAAHPRSRPLPQIPLPRSTAAAAVPSPTSHAPARIPLPGLVTSASPMPLNWDAGSPQKGSTTLPTLGSPLTPSEWTGTLPVTTPSSTSTATTASSGTATSNPSTSEQYRPSGREVPVDVPMSLQNDMSSSAESDRSRGHSANGESAVEPAVSSWTNHHVMQWLLTLGLQHHIGKFEANGIDGTRLLDMSTSQELATIGITDQHERRLIKQKVKELRRVLKKERARIERNAKKAGSPSASHSGASGDIPAGGLKSARLKLAKKLSSSTHI